MLIDFIKLNKSGLKDFMPSQDQVKPLEKQINNLKQKKKYIKKEQKENKRSDEYSSALFTAPGICSQRRSDSTFLQNIYASNFSIKNETLNPL